jgi:hypothetical protein
MLLTLALVAHLDSRRDGLTAVRRKIFDAALAVSLAGVLLLIAGLTRAVFSRDVVSTGWKVSNLSAIGFWFFGSVGAFFGKHNARVLLVMAQAATLLSAYAAIMMLLVVD